MTCLKVCGCCKMERNELEIIGGSRLIWEEILVDAAPVVAVLEAICFAVALLVAQT